MHVMHTVDQIHRRPAVTALTGLPRSSLYAAVADGQFPRPVRLGNGKSRSVGWRNSDLIAWLAARAVTTSPRCPQ